MSIVFSQKSRLQYNAVPLPRTQITSGYIEKFQSITPRFFHTSKIFYGEKVPFKLSDIGEGITEVTVKEW